MIHVTENPPGLLMETAFNSSLVVLLVLYTALVMTYVWIFALGRERTERLARPLLLATAGVHLVSLVFRGAAIHGCPLGHPADFMALVAFSITTIYLLLELRIGDRTTGLFAIGPAFLLQVIASVHMLGSSDAAARIGVFDSVHTFAAIIGYSAVALSTVYGYLYLFLYLAIKRGMFGLFYKKMPPLETLSDQISISMWVAFLALTVTVGLGFWGYFSMSGHAVALLEPAVLLTLVLWLLYGGCLGARRFFGLGGKRFAYMTALGLLPLVGILAGTLFARGFHG